MQTLKLKEPYGKCVQRNKSFFNTPVYFAGMGFVPDWTFHEAFRELFANLIDQARTVADKFVSENAKLEYAEQPGRCVVHVGDVLLAEIKMTRKKKTNFVFGYRMSGETKAKAVPIRKDKVDTQVIELINYTSTLSFEKFGVGESSKKDNPAVIGKYGEGLTGACAMLTRAGHNVMIECHHNQYRADIVPLKKRCHYQLERSEGKVSSPDTVRIQIKIHPNHQAVPSLHELLQSVHLSPADAAAGVATDHGILLTAPHMRGKVFVRSLFVKYDPDSRFGFCLYDPEKTLLETRDRNSVGNAWFEFAVFRSCCCI